MKKTWKYLLMATVVLGLSMGVTSCSDDDDNETNGNEELKAQDPYEKNGTEATALFRVVGTLCELDSLPDNWKTATYEPTKGKVLDASQPLVRSVAVANLAEAVSMYRTLTGKNLADNATRDSWSKEGVGSLTFTANPSDESAVIDLNIKQMPRLTQLRLVPASAMGENGTFTGDPYYHIGDVVKDKDGRHWICVRSAYSPAGKEDTHWVTMQLLTSDSKKTKFKSNVRLIKAKAQKNGQHKIQQKLSNSEDIKHLKYFAQLMYLLNDPNEYANHYAKGDVMEDGLGDLGVSAHNLNYLKNLARYWNTNDIWGKVLPGIVENNNLKMGTVKKSFFSDAAEGITMLYYGHDFSSLGLGNECTIYTCQQSGACMSTQTLGDKTWTYCASENTKFDCTDFALQGKADEKNTNVGYTGNAIVVVQASGKQLNGGTNPGPTKKIGTCTDILVGKDKNFDKEPPKNVNDYPEVGYIINANGDLYTKYEDASTEADYNPPVAMIVYIGTGGTDMPDEGTLKRFLAISLEPAVVSSTKTFDWGPTDKLCGVAYNQDKEYQKFIGTKNGLTFTQNLSKETHNHAAAKQCTNFFANAYVSDHQPKADGAYKPSSPFLPAAGQWVYAMKGMGAWDFSSNGTKFIETINALYEKAGVPQSKRLPMDGSSIWTCTEASKDSTYVLKIDKSNGARFVKEKKSTKCTVKPFILYE